MATTIFLLALAGFGGVALDALAAVAVGAAAGVLLGDLAFLGLAHAGVAERVGPAIELFIAERTQDDAGRLCGGGGRGRGGGRGELACGTAGGRAPFRGGGPVRGPCGARGPGAALAPL